MSKIRNCIGAVLARELALGLSACEKKEGPAERAGKEIDKTVESAGSSWRRQVSRSRIRRRTPKR